MNDDLELKEWQSLWQRDVHLPSGLRETAMKQVRRLRTMLLADIGVTVGMGGACTIWAMRSSQPMVRLLAIWVWLTLVAAWIFRWFNNGGNWTGAAPNTHVFLERLRKSYRATLRNVAFGWLLGAVQLLFGSVWVYRELSRHERMSPGQFLTLTPNLFLWACAAAAFGWSVRFFLRVRREVACVERLQREWESEEVEAEKMPAPVRTGTLVKGFLRHAERLVPADFGWNLRRKKKSWRV